MARAMVGLLTCRRPKRDAPEFVGGPRPVVGPAWLPLDVDENAPEQAAPDSLNGIEGRERCVDCLGPDRDYDTRNQITCAVGEDGSGPAVARVEQLA
jgi:hypothetical protein